MKRLLFTLAAMAMAATAQAADLGGLPSANDVLAAPAAGRPINWNAVWIGIQGGYSNSQPQYQCQGLWRCG